MYILFNTIRGESCLILTSLTVAVKCLLQTEQRETEHIHKYCIVFRLWWPCCIDELQEYSQNIEHHARSIHYTM